MGRRWKAGAKDPVEGKPYAQWKVREVAPPERVKAKHLVPLTNGDKGDVWEYVAEIVFVPIQSEIWVHFAPGSTLEDQRNAWDFAVKARDSETSLDRYSPLELPGQGTVHYSTIGHRLSGSRCSVEGCQSFGSWHVGENHSAEHVAEEIRTEGYVLRLVLRYGDWVPEVKLTSYRLDTTTEAASLANDIEWMLGARRNLMTPKAVIA